MVVYSAFNQSGGAVVGNLLVSGPFAYSGGVFNGQLISQSAATFSANFTAPGGMENDGTLTVSGPRTLTFNGPGLDNFGAITLAADARITASSAASVPRITGQITGAGNLELASWAAGTDVLQLANTGSANTTL